MRPKEELKDLAFGELQNIKKFATPGEWSKLVTYVDHLKSQADLCVYGLMTGHCFTDRANELARKCSVLPVGYTNCLEEKTLDESPWMVKEMEGDREVVFGNQEDDDRPNFTALEVYLALRPEEVKSMIRELAA